jgi:RNA polymerase sigma-70 factor (ECF subfamily)
LELHELIKLCKQQNSQAQSELFLRYKDVLFTLCLKYCKSHAEAEDHLQDSFIRIFQNIKRYADKGSFEGWMKRIVINAAIDRYKKDLYTVSVDEQRIAEADTAIDEQAMHLPLKTLLGLVQELPSRYRLIFNLYELDGYSHNEIADQLGISVGTSKSNLHRAKLILKEKVLALRADRTVTKNLKHG